MRNNVETALLSVSYNAQKSLISPSFCQFIQPPALKSSKHAKAGFWASRGCFGPDLISDMRNREQFAVVGKWYLAFPMSFLELFGPETTAIPTFLRRSAEKPRAFFLKESRALGWLLDVGGPERL
jgi:hypothetical protein